jgi:hypothetical protein
MGYAPGEVSYDLTTPEGIAKAIKDYAKNNYVKAAVHAINPLIALPTILGNAIFELGSKLAEHPEKMIEAQRKAAVDIIKAGKKNGASKIRVTLDQKAGIDIGGALEGYELKFAVGTNNKMTIEVDYK